MRKIIFKYNYTKSKYIIIAIGYKYIMIYEKKVQKYEKNSSEI